MMPRETMIVFRIKSRKNKQYVQIPCVRSAKQKQSIYTGTFQQVSTRHFFKFAKVTKGDMLEGPGIVYIK